MSRPLPIAGRLPASSSALPRADNGDGFGTVELGTVLMPVSTPPA